MTLTVCGYTFEFDGAVDAIELGEAATRDHSDMQLVAFAVEFDDRYVFVELVPPKAAAKGVKAEGEFCARLKSERLCDELARKYRDSMFFHSHGGTTPKPVEYAVLYAPEGIDEILVTVLEDELKRRIPLSHPVWREDSADSCSVMTVNQWHKRFGADSLAVASPSAGR